ncbi:hypothetical protein X975_23991, partial [Stegodyphus mimosarum]
MEAKGFSLTWGYNQAFDDKEISLLIGSDFYWNLTKGFERLNTSLVIVKTELGWSLQGNCDDLSKTAVVNVVLGDQSTVSAELRRFWELENLGITNKETERLTLVEQEILEEFNNSVGFVDGRYCVKLLWKPGMQEKLANNREVAWKRFEGLVRRFRNDIAFFEDYKRVIDDYRKEGIIENSSSDIELSCFEQSFYLP